MKKLYTLFLFVFSVITTCFLCLYTNMDGYTITNATSNNLLNENNANVIVHESFDNHAFDSGTVVDKNIITNNSRCNMLYSRGNALVNVDEQGYRQLYYNTDSDDSGYDIIMYFDIKYI